MKNYSNIKISPSLLASDFSIIKDILINLDSKMIYSLHFDVMDNHFVNNLAFCNKFIKDLRKYTIIDFDIHFMVNNPDKIIHQYLDCGAKLFIFHIETINDIKYLTNICKKNNIKFGLAFNPDTNVNSIIEYLPIIDVVLAMSVQPGFAGQKFITQTINKFKILNSHIREKKLKTKLQADGGVKLNNIKELYKAGVDIFVIGSEFFKYKNYKELIDNINSLVHNLI